MPRMSSKDKITRQKVKTYFNKIDKNVDKKKLKKELDKLWRECAILRIGNKCEYYGCNKTDNLNVHHIFTRSKMVTRWDINNAMVLCPYHHSLSNEAAHSDIYFKDKITGVYPGFVEVRTKEEIDALDRKAASPYKLDLKLEKLYLEDYLSKLNKLI